MSNGDVGKAPALSLGHNNLISAQTDEKRYLYDGLDLIEIRDILDVPMARVVFGPGIDNPLALIELNGSGTETARYYYHTDHLGSVRLLTDASGAVAETYDYSAYGVRLDDPAADTTLNPFTYTAREYHPESGLYFYRARFYDPAVGSFISADPIGLNGGVNVYGYARTNPVHFIDPLGLFWKELGELIRDWFDATNPIRRAEETFGSDPIEPVQGPSEEDLNGGIDRLRYAAGQVPEYAHEATELIGENCAIAAIGLYGLTGYTKHGLNQVLARDGGRGVATRAILDALRNPKSIEILQDGTRIIKGKDATVVLNAAGKLITAYARSLAGVRNPLP